MMFEETTKQEMIEQRNKEENNSLSLMSFCLSCPMMISDTNELRKRERDMKERRIVQNHAQTHFPSHPLSLRQNDIFCALSTISCLRHYFVRRYVSSLPECVCPSHSFIRVSGPRGDNINSNI